MKQGEGMKKWLQRDEEALLFFILRSLWAIAIFLGYGMPFIILGFLLRGCFK